MWNQNNPFLYDIMALEEPEQQEAQGPAAPLFQQQLAANVALQPHQAGGGSSVNIKLPVFWPHAPAM
jgi:hypothetical protein